MSLVKDTIQEWVLIIDTREQRPWTFQDISARTFEQTMKVKALRSGDYSIEGFEEHIIIERKSVGDLLGTLTKGRKRFEKELERLRSIPWSAIVVEGSWDEALRTCERETSINPESITGSILAYMQRFPMVHWIFRETRALAEATAWRALDRFWKDHNERQTDTTNPI